MCKCVVIINNLVLRLCLYLPTLDFITVAIIINIIIHEIINHQGSMFIRRLRIEWGVIQSISYYATIAGWY